jgi:hypothetical protein
VTWNRDHKSPSVGGCSKGSVPDLIGLWEPQTWPGVVKQVAESWVGPR